MQIIEINEAFAGCDFGIHQDAGWRRMKQVARDAKKTNPNAEPSPSDIRWAPAADAF